MNIFSKDVFLVGVATVITGIAMTTLSTTASGVAYTASGTTDAKTAKLFNNLLKNSKHLQVQTHVSPSVGSTKSASNLEVNYNVSGTTDIKTARKLIKLFRDSQHVDVIVNVHQKSNSVVNNRLTQNMPNQMVSAPVFMPQNPAVYVQSPDNPNNWYPVAMWKKVPLSTMIKATQTEPTNSDTAVELANQ